MNMSSLFQIRVCQKLNDTMVFVIIGIFKSLPFKFCLSNFIIVFTFSHTSVLHKFMNNKRIKFGLIITIIVIASLNWKTRGNKRQVGHGATRRQSQSVPVAQPTPTLTRVVWPGLKLPKTILVFVADFACILKFRYGNHAHVLPIL